MAIPLDSSSFARTLTLTNGADLVGTLAKFGAGSLRCAGTGATATTGYGITAPTSTDFNIGASGQFTVECWAYFNTAQTDSGFIGRWSPNQFFLFQSSGSLIFRFVDSGTNVRDTNAGAWTPVPGQWYHLAADRDASNVVRLYIDGVVKASNTFSQAWQVVTNTLQIGFVGGVATSGFQMDGYLDEMRFSNTARYGGAFTPSASAFTSDANTLLLVHANDPGNIARVSQAVIEVLRTNTAVKARVSQAVVEALRVNLGANLQISQAALEVLRTITSPQLQISQAALEVLRVNGSSTPIGTDVPLLLIINN